MMEVSRQNETNILVLLLLTSSPKSEVGGSG
jgi:hypothetical protein